MVSRFLIYALTDPDGAIRYVGKSSSGLRRPREHGSPADLGRPTYKANWIRALRSQGHDFAIVVLEEIHQRADLNAAERRWIARGRAEGWRLTNATDGGDGGATNTGRQWSEKTRHRMSKAAQNRSPEHGLKISEANRQRHATAAMSTPEARAKAAAAVRGVPKSPEHRAKLKEAAKQRAQTDEGRARMRAARARRGRVVSAETRARISATKRSRRLPRLRINLIGAI